MNQKVIEAVAEFGVPLSEVDCEKVTAFLGITDKRRNLSSEQKLLLERVCELVQQGESVEETIAILGSENGSSAESSVEELPEFRSTDEADLNTIIESQASSAADAALMNLPNLASAEMESLRQAFIRQFRKRIREQLHSTEFQSAFIAKIECQAQLPVRSSSTANTALPSSSSEEC